MKKKTALFICTAFMSAALFTGCDDKKDQLDKEVPPASGGMSSATAVARMDLVTAQGTGSSVGTVTFMDNDSKTGLEIKVELDGLPPGQHGFHVHEKGDCGPAEQNGSMVAAGAAGGHYDPDRTGKHLGPNGGGHKGDLPILNVNPAGALTGVFTVEGVTVADFKGRALMIHEGGDNYLDEPAELGGGGARIACGVIR